MGLPEKNEIGEKRKVTNEISVLRENKGDLKC